MNDGKGEKKMCHFQFRIHLLHIWGLGEKILCKEGGGGGEGGRRSLEVKNSLCSTSSSSSSRFKMQINCNGEVVVSAVAAAA
ncbi:hypothetical protein TYRP_006806 [Tyrophagus putrescentiae]|nr:hypothetical protein TYRP_006806 [Tyrophagus putrescentiae]